MKDELTLKDFFRFFIDNIKLIIGTIIILGMVSVGYVVYSHTTSDYSGIPGESPVELTTPSMSEERYEELAGLPLELLSEPQIRQMQAYLLPNAYRLTIYAEHENHEPIANTTFMREVFRNKEVLTYIEDRLGEELTPALEFAVHVENLGNSGIYELHFQRGTPEESLELGYIMMDAIAEEVIPVLDNKLVYFIDEEPEVIVGDYSDYIDGMNQESGLSVRAILRDIVLYGIIALIVGLIIGILLALLSAVLNRKVTALYDYVREDSDKVVRLNHLRKMDANEKIEKGIKNINLPSAHNKVVLYDKATEGELNGILSNLSSNVSHYTDFSLVNDNMQTIDEVVLLATVNKTSKSWYNNQRVQLNGYNIPIKVIQF